MDRCQALGLTLNPKKCIFSVSSIPFWGCIISDQGIKPNPLKIQTLQQSKRPHTKEELISFLAMVRANSDFIPSLAKHTSNLRQLTKKGVHFNWQQVHETEFNMLKNRFNEAVLLKYFDPSVPTFIHVDASPDGFGAILCQGDSVDTATPVTVASRSTTSAESRYPQIDLEAMAIDFALHRFRVYLVGGPTVVVLTDHKPLLPIFNETRVGSIRSERIKLRNQDIPFKLIYCDGKSNISDYFSRHAVSVDTLDKDIQSEAAEHGTLLYALNICKYTEAISDESIVQYIHRDSALRKLRYAIKMGICPEDGVDLQPYKKLFSELTGAQPEI